MSQRQIRVGHSLRAALAEMLARGVIKDPRVADAGLITVTDVNVSTDLHHARVFVSIYGDDAKRQAAVQGLERAAGFLRREVGRELGLKFFPNLDFKLDESMQQQAHIEELLREVNRGPNDGDGDGNP